MNTLSKISEDGRVTIPQDVLDQLGVGPGSDVIFSRTADGRVTIERNATEPLPPSRFRELLGCAGPGPTTDEIMEVTRGE